MTPTKPPRLLEALVERLLAGDANRESTLGDLAEDHAHRRARRGRGAADLAYLRQALSLLLHRTASRGPKPSAEAGVTERSALALVTAGRALRRRPGFTLLATGILAVALAAATAAFSVTVGTLEAARGWRHEDRTALVWPGEPFSMGQLTTVQEGNRAFETLGAFVDAPAVLALDEESASAAGVVMSPDLFAALRARPVLGRGLLPEDGEVGADPVVVLGHGLWTRAFGADPSVVGRVVDVNGLARRVVGVMPRGARHPGTGTELWMPLVLDPFDPDFWPRRDLEVVGVMRPGISVESAREDVVRVLGELARRFPFFYRPDYGRDATLALAGASTWAGVSVPLLLLLWGTALLLVVAAIDVGNLVLARSLERRTELQVRAAVGASRGQVVRQMALEGALRAGIAGLAGWALGGALARTLPGLFPHGSLVAPAAANGAAVATFVGGGTLLAWGLMAGIPIGHFLVSTRRDLAPRRRRGPSGILVVTQAALATVLLVTAALLLRTVQSLGDVPLGFRPGGVAAVKVAPRGDVDPSGLLLLREAVAERVAAGPGIEGAGWISSVPLLDAVTTAPVNLETRPVEVAEAPTAARLVVDHRALDALGIRVVTGRGFDRTDGREGAPVALVNGTLARLLWPDEDPVGQRIAVDPHDWNRWVTVVGVVEDARFRDLMAPAGAAFFLPHRQASAPAMTLVARTAAGTPAGVVAGSVRGALAELAPEVPAGAARDMTGVVRDAYGAARVLTVLLGGMAVLATLLGAAGLYGALAGWVARRAGEMGTRLALGAAPGRLSLGVMRTGLLLTVAGVVTGCAGGAIAGRAVGSLLYGVSPTDPWAFAVPAAVLMLTGAVAAAVPAIRAARVSPARALTGG